MTKNSRLPADIFTAHGQPSPFIGSWYNRPETPETSRHDYEPGEMTHPTQTDPLCRICGRASEDRAHR